MFRLKILLARLRSAFSTLPLPKKLLGLLIPGLSLTLILVLTPLGAKGALLFSGNAAVYQNLSILLNDDPLKVHIIDVGQGDATLIQHGDANILMDCGPPEAAISLVNYLDSLGVNRLDLLILTHPHDDHTGSVSVLMQSMDIAALMVPHDIKDDPFLKDALARAEREGIPVTIPFKGTRIQAGEFSMECLHPQDQPYADINDYSSTWSIHYGSVRLLFLADLSVEAAEGLGLNRHAFLRCGHHGSITSLSAPLLEKLRPHLAAISSGADNKFGHPSKEVLELLKTYAIPCLRTDLSGTMVLSTDGARLSHVH